MGFTMKETFLDFDDPNGNRTQKSYLARVDPTFDSENRGKFVVSYEDGSKYKLEKLDGDLLTRPILATARRRRLYIFLSEGRVHLTLVTTVVRDVYYLYGICVVPCPHDRGAVPNCAERRHATITFCLRQIDSHLRFYPYFAPRFETV